MTSVKKLIEAVVAGKAPRKVLSEALSPKAMMSAGRVFDTLSQADLNKARLALMSLLEEGIIVKVVPHSMSARKGPMYSFLPDGKGKVHVYHGRQKMVSLPVSAQRQLLELLSSAGELDPKGRIVFSFDS